MLATDAVCRAQEENEITIIVVCRKVMYTASIGRKRREVKGRWMQNWKYMKFIYFYPRNVSPKSILNFKDAFKGSK